MTNNFNEKPNFPFTYGDKDTHEAMLSDYIVELMKTKRFQSHVTAMFFALLTLVSYAQPSSAIPPEYGEAANEMLNQAAQNGAAAGGTPAVPPIGEIRGQVPVVPPVNQQYQMPAMPIEQQRLIAAQQAGRGMPIAQLGPTDPPAFYIPDKPVLKGTRAANTALFTASLGVICLNAAWGEPVAVLMCTSGLAGLAYKIGKDIVIFMAKSLT